MKESADDRIRISPVKKVNVGEQVFEQLKQLLVQKVWKPREKLPSENELAGMFKVSRITVRQALQKLMAQGFLETRLGEGSFVKEVGIDQNLDLLVPVLYLMDKENNEQVMEFREIIETGSVKIAAKRAEEEDLNRLEDLISEMEAAAGKNDFETFVDRDMTFHLYIGEFTHNALIVRTYAILKDILLSSMKALITERGYKSGISYHKQILEAMRNRDEDECERLMYAHIRNSKYHWVKGPA